MLDGITILDQVQLTEPYTVFVVLTLIFVGIVLLSLASFYFGLYDNELAFTIITLSSAILAMVFIILLAIVQKPTGKYTYKVMVDESVSMVKFDEMYETIRQEGKIYTIELKENKND